MQNSALHRGLTDIEIEKLSKCMGMKLKICNTNETIMSFNRNTDTIYIVLSGVAELIYYDYDGNKTILERYQKDSVFSEMFSPYTNFDEVFVSAKSPCRVLILSYSKILSQCENACRYHRIMLDNFFKMLADKMVAQSHHIEVLSKRSIREKLLSYFKIISDEKGSDFFAVPFSLSSLADYLSIDRSAMQREIKRLNDEGIIESSGREISIIKRL